jgi:hypothetical protein
MTMLPAVCSTDVRAGHAALVFDGAGYHLAKDPAIPENITLVGLPPYAPELNPVENVWEYLRRSSPVFRRRDRKPCGAGEPRGSDAGDDGKGFCTVARYARRGNSCAVCGHHGIRRPGHVAHVRDRPAFQGRLGSSVAAGYLPEMQGFRKLPATADGTI